MYIYICIYIYRYRYIFCFLYMLILPVFCFFARIFPFISLFFPLWKTRFSTAPRWFTRIAPRVWPGNPQLCWRNFGRFVTVGFLDPPKTLRFVYMGVITNGDGKPSNKNDGIHWNSTPLPGIKWRIQLDAKCCWWFWRFFSQVISAWSLGHMDVS